MLIGVPKEIKDHEGRVGLVPSSVSELITHGHSVRIEAGAGSGAGISDADYSRSGAEIVTEADAVWSAADMVIKVKEPLSAERTKLRPGQSLHLPSSCARFRADERSHTIRRHLHRLRDRDQSVRRVASSDANVGSRRSHVDSGGCPLPGERAAGPRHAACRSPRCASG